MAKYIDADALKDSLLLDQAGYKDILRTSCNLHPVRERELMFRVDAISYYVEEINKIPTADVAEVVRCKDCTKRGTFRCVKSRGEHPTNTKNTEFCCWGEKRD
jgi:hypothetical protein